MAMRYLLTAVGFYGGSNCLYKEQSYKKEKISGADDKFRINVVYNEFNDEQKQKMNTFYNSFSEEQRRKIDSHYTILWDEEIKLRQEVVDKFCIKNKNSKDYRGDIIPFLGNLIISLKIFVEKPEMFGLQEQNRIKKEYNFFSENDENEVVRTIIKKFMDHAGEKNVTGPMIGRIDTSKGRIDMIKDIDTFIKTAFTVIAKVKKNGIGYYGEKEKLNSFSLLDQAFELYVTKIRCLYNEIRRQLISKGAW